MGTPNRGAAAFCFHRREYGWGRGQEPAAAQPLPPRFREEEGAPPVLMSDLGWSRVPGKGGEKNKIKNPQGQREKIPQALVHRREAN